MLWISSRVGWISGVHSASTRRGLSTIRRNPYCRLGDSNEAWGNLIDDVAHFVEVDGRVVVLAEFPVGTVAA